jgi:hypothetical protein
MHPFPEIARADDAEHFIEETGRTRCHGHERRQFFETGLKTVDQRTTPPIQWLCIPTLDTRHEQRDILHDICQGNGIIVGDARKMSAMRMDNHIAIGTPGLDIVQQIVDGLVDRKALVLSSEQREYRTCDLIRIDARIGHGATSIEMTVDKNNTRHAILESHGIAQCEPSTQGMTHKDGISFHIG